MLIEVLVASVLICIFATSITYLASTAVRQIHSTKNLTDSILTAKSMMEVLRSEPYDKLFTYDNQRFDDGDGQIVVVPKGNELALIRILYKTVDLETLRSRY
jgi:Tfp pilus assembly protein PilV